MSTYTHMWVYQVNISGRNLKIWFNKALKYTQFLGHIISHNTQYKI